MRRFQREMRPCADEFGLSERALVDIVAGRRESSQGFSVNPQNKRRNLAAKIHNGRMDQDYSFPIPPIWL
jgi:hypothetical protein